MGEAHFTFYTPDSLGKKATDYYEQLSGRLLVHQGNGKVYEPVGFSWNGESDTWGLVHREHGSAAAPMIWRSFDNVFGNRSDGRPRFMTVDARAK